MDSEEGLIMPSLYQTLTVTLTNTSTTTLTLTSTDLDSAKRFCQNVIKNGSLFDNNGVFYPATAILSIVIS